MSTELKELKPNDMILRKGKVVPIASSRQIKSNVAIKPKVELALRAYAAGQFVSQDAAAASCGMTPQRFNVVVNSPAGQTVIDDVRRQLDFKYQTLYKKFIGVVEDGLDHPDPGVALAAASLYQRSQIGTKVNVVLSAEDVVKQIMDGTYQGDD